MKINFRKIKLLLYLVVVFLIIYAFTHVFLFLYENFYQVITQSEEILVLQKKVAIDTVDIEKFNEVMEKIKSKTKKEYLGRINNPFD